MSTSIDALRMLIAATNDAERRIELQNELLVGLLREDWRSVELEAQTMLEDWSSQHNPHGTALSQLFLARTALIRGAVRDAIALCEKAIQEIRLVGDEKILAHAFLVLSHAHHSLTDYATSMKFAQDALSILENLDEKALHVDVLDTIGQNYVYLSDFKTALQYTLIALNLARESGNKLHEVNELRSVAEIYSYLSNFEQAIPMMNEALTISRETNSFQTIINCLGGLCNMYCLTMDWEHALPCAVELLRISNQSGAPMNEAKAHIALAIIYQGSAQLDLAEAHLAEAMDLSNDTENKYIIRLGLIMMASLKGEREEIAHAQRLAEEALSLFHHHEDITNLTRVLEFLVGICERQQKIEQALYYQKQLADACLFQEREQNHRDILLMQVKIDTALIEQERESYKVKAMQAVDAFERQTIELNELSKQLAMRKDLLIALRNDLAAVERDLSSPELQSIRRKIDSEITTEHTSEQVDVIIRMIEPEFGTMLSDRYPELSKTEIRLCLFIKLDLRTPDISRLLHLSERTVENHRLHIRKKMKLAERTSLHHHLKALTQHGAASRPVTAAH